MPQLSKRTTYSSSSSSSGNSCSSSSSSASCFRLRVDIFKISQQSIQTINSKELLCESKSEKFWEKRKLTARELEGRQEHGGAGASREGWEKGAWASGGRYSSLACPGASMEGWEWLATAGLGDESCARVGDCFRPEVGGYTGCFLMWLSSSHVWLMCFDVWNGCDRCFTTD